MSLSPITAEALTHPGLRHAFFTREGGISEGVYASLNGGVGSHDAPATVAENRRRMAEFLGVTTEKLCVPFQIHSAEALVISHAFPANERPRLDGLVTRTPGLALGVTGADCGMVLLADPAAKVIGAVHSGWKGAFTGVLEATVEAMVGAGATLGSITAVLGPTIGQASYEVGPEFFDRFIARDRDFAGFFRPSPKTGHHMFDLPGFIGRQLQATGIGRFENLQLDTYADEARFFSYRRTTHRSEPDYGRLVSAIVIEA